MEELVMQLTVLRERIVERALEEFIHLVKTVPNIRGETEKLSVDFSPYGILVTIEEELFTRKAFISYFEVDTLIQDTISLDKGIYEEHLLESLSDIVLEELERWRNSTKSNVIVQEIS